MDRGRRQENAIEVRRKEEKQPRRLRKAQRGRQKTRWVSQKSRERFRGGSHQLYKIQQRTE